MRLLFAFKCGGYDHYDVYLSKGLHFCFEKPKSKLENHPKKEKTNNEDELSDKCDYYDDMT